jgi:hypothetical protein
METKYFNMKEEVNEFYKEIHLQDIKEIIKKSS